MMITASLCNHGYSLLHTCVHSLTEGTETLLLTLTLLWAAGMILWWQCDRHGHFSLAYEVSFNNFVVSNEFIFQSGLSEKLDTGEVCECLARWATVRLQWVRIHPPKFVSEAMSMSAVAATGDNTSSASSCLGLEYFFFFFFFFL